MERSYEVGAHIKFIDSRRRPHNALVLIWWKAPQVEPYTSDDGEPGCNLVLVDPDEHKNDDYGRQIKRETSVVHLSVNPARGNCWCWPDEVP